MRTLDNLKELFDSFNNLTVLIVGDVMIDSYLWGKSSRLSPEAPVPIVNVIKTEKRLGGAANVALNIQALGAKPLLCSVIGDDQDGADFIRLMDEKQLSSEGIVKSPERITTIKQRILSGNQQLLRIDSEEESELAPYEERHLLERYQNLLKTADVVIFEDYDKGVLTQANIAVLLELAQANNIPTIVDPKKKNFLNYIGCTIFKPNLKELKEGLKLDFADSNTEQFEAAVDELQSRLQLENVLVTLSERGVFIQEGKTKTYIDAHRRSISDVSGAGDTVVSIAAVCLALKTPMAMLAGLANLGGGLVCEQVGVVPVDKGLLYEEAREYNLFETLAFPVKP